MVMLVAALLTLVETPWGSESCALPASECGVEVVSPESLTGWEPGVSEAAMKGVVKKRLSGAAKTVKRAEHEQ
jgi:hypothetical protein